MELKRSARTGTGNRARARGGPGRTLAAAAVLALALSGSAALAQQTGAELVKAADEVLESVVRIRGLKPRGEVRKGVKSREEIARYLEERVRDSYEDAELEREGRLYKLLGLLPADMAYRDFILKLLTEQVGGYYDPQKKTFFIAGWLPLDQQKPVMAHELVHALQDQYFDIERFTKRDRKADNDDRVLAQQALVEGDGLAVMLDYMLTPLGRDFTQLPGLVAMMRAQMGALDSQFEIFNRAPEFLKESLLFPYVYGAAFLQKVKGSGPWTSVDRVYSDLPESTEQIMHPEKYAGARDAPQPVEAADPAPLLGSDWKTSYRNVLGEFGFFLVLKLHRDETESTRAAAGWDGDRILLVESGSRSAAFGETVWDSGEEAADFARSLGSWFEGRFPGGRRADVGDARGWAAEGALHAVELRGARVRYVLGLPEQQRTALRAYWK